LQGRVIFWLFLLTSSSHEIRGEINFSTIFSIDKNYHPL
jgi:hypothetical protein